MNRPERIELEAGSGAWLQLSQLLIGLLGIVVLLASALPAAWKAVMTVASGLAFAAGVFGPRPRAAIHRVILHLDGSAILATANGTVRAQLADGGWSSRWCCVVPFGETPGRRRFRCLVCASRNSADAYRRLLVQLRLNAAAEPEHGVGSP
jgi:hypothetical protein